MLVWVRHPWATRIQAVVFCSFTLSAFAQQPRSPKLPAPPPMRFVSAKERSQLEATRDSKSRVQATLELAANHLTRAEEFTSQKQFDLASEEIGSYLGLVDDAMSYVGSMSRDKGRTRDLYKNVDLALRKHLPRLAVMRRETPVDYAGNIKASEDYVRDVRDEALNSFYGHTVLREDAEPKKPEGAKDSPEPIKRP